MNFFAKRESVSNTPPTFSPTEFNDMVKMEIIQNHPKQLKSPEILASLIMKPEEWGQNNSSVFVAFVKNNNLTEYDLEQWAYRLLVVTKKLGSNSRPKYSDILTGEHTQRTLAYAQQLYDWAFRRGHLQKLGQTFTRDHWKKYTYSQRISEADFGTGTIKADPQRIHKINEHGRFATYYSCDYCGKLQPFEMIGEGAMAIFSEACLTCGAKFDFTEVSTQSAEAKAAGKEDLSWREQKIRKQEIILVQDPKTGQMVPKMVKDPKTGKEVEEKEDITVLIKQKTNKILFDISKQKYKDPIKIRKDFEELAGLLVYSKLDLVLMYYRALDYIEKHRTDQYGRKTAKEMLQPKSVTSLLNQTSSILWLEIIGILDRNYNNLKYSNKYTAIAALLIDVIVPRDIRQSNVEMTPPVLKFNPRLDLDPEKKTVKARFCRDCGNAFKIDLAEQKVKPQSTKYRSDTNNLDVFELMSIADIPCPCCNSINTDFQFARKNSAPELTREQLKKPFDLVKAIQLNFAKQEFIQLCSKLGVDYEDLEGDNDLNRKALELVKYSQRRGQFNQLIDTVLGFSSNSALGGEMINVKCTNCGTIATKSLNQNQQIEGVCENCQQNREFSIYKAK